MLITHPGPPLAINGGVRTLYLAGRILLLEFIEQVPASLVTELFVWAVFEHHSGKLTNREIHDPNKEGNFPSSLEIVMSMR